MKDYIKGLSAEQLVDLMYAAESESQTALADAAQVEYKLRKSCCEVCGELIGYNKLQHCPQCGSEVQREKESFPRRTKMKFTTHGRDQLYLEINADIWLIYPNHDNSSVRVHSLPDMACHFVPSAELIAKITPKLKSIGTWYACHERKIEQYISERTSKEKKITTDWHFIPYDD